MGWSAFSQENSFKKRNLPLSLRRKVYKQCILLVLTYGSEIWSITKVLKQKLQSNQMGTESIMFSIKGRKRRRGSMIREQIKVEDILTIIEIQKWKKWT